MLSLLGEAWTFIKGLVDEGDLGALWSIGWFPRRGLYDLRTIIVGTFIIAVIGIAHRDAARSWCCDLPRRVRQPRGLVERSSRSSRSLPESPRLSSDSGRSSFIGPEIVQRIFPTVRRVQHVVRRACRRRAHHATRCIGIRGRNASCPGVAPRGIIWSWSEPSDYHHTSRGSSSDLWDHRVPDPRVLHARSEKR